MTEDAKRKTEEEIVKEEIDRIVKELGDPESAPKAFNPLRFFLGNATSRIKYRQELLSEERN